jgi:hypothetical protein
VSSANALRVAVVVYIAAALLFFALSFVPQELPAEALSYAKWRAIQPLDAIVRGATTISIIALIVSIGSAIGLLFWLPAVRLVFTTCILLMLSAELFLGYPMLIAGTESFLNTLASISAGFIIALSYFSAVNSKYQSRKSGSD